MLNKIITAPLPDTKAIAIPSPISGIGTALADTPNTLVASGMLGQGLAIELQGHQVLAPFKSTVTQLPATKHCIQLTAANGLQLYIQLGLDSEQLMGAGFSSTLKVGDQVERFSPLIEFDLLYLKRHLNSLLSPVTFCQCDKLKGIQPFYGRITAKESIAMRLYL